MWKYNRTSKKWYKDIDTLNIDTFNFQKQELEKIHYYSRCLHGSTYIPITGFNDIYNQLSYNNKDSNFYVDSTYATYSATQSNSINSLSRDYYNKYLDEYGFTIKNLFTPNRLIDDSIKNFIYVDLATTEIIDLTTTNLNLVIDGIRVLNGHRVLVKDNLYTVVLSNLIDPNDYFIGNYYIQSKDSTTNTYLYYAENNGIYLYNNGKLSRENDIDDYSTSQRYSVGVKLGLINRDKEFHLSRLLNGEYPTINTNNPIEFKDKHNYVLRHEVEYQNLLEISYYDSISSDSIIRSDGKTPPKRQVIVGEYGMIVINQDGGVNAIPNKYKNDIYSVSKTSTDYWCCGESGLILKIDNFTLNIKKINISTNNNLKSIIFFDDMNGFVVGEFNTIFYTNDGGYNWNKISISEFNDFNYTKVIMPTFNRVFISGNNGFLCELNLSFGEWVVNKLTPYKYLDYDDEYLIIDNINDMLYVNTTSVNLSYSSIITSTISANKEFLFIVGDNGMVLIYDVNNFLEQYDSIWLDLSINESIKSVIYKFGKYYINTNTNIYTIDLSIPFSITDISNQSSIVKTDITSLSVSNGDKIIKLSDNFFYNNITICGNNTSIKNIDSFNNTSMNVGNLVSNNLKSKLLILDYDMASKLNFYDSNHEYRLPEPYSIDTLSISTISRIDITNIDGDKNWLVYYKDSIKDFNYNYSSLSDLSKVQFNTTFDYLSYSYSISVTNSTNRLSDIGDLMPTYYHNVSSGVLPIGPPVNNYDLYLYDDIIILSGSYSATIGDVFLLESDIVSDSLILNNIQTFSGINYYYFNTSFNQNIINNLTLSNNISIKNLNRFDSYSDLVTNFNTHPIHYGYSMELDTINNLTINALYNNKTAYYNMQFLCTTYTINDDVILDMNFNGVNNTQIFIDNTGKTVNARLNPILSTLEYTSSPSSVYFDGNNSYLQLSYSSDFDFTTRDFNINVDINLDDNTIPNPIIGMVTSDSIPIYTYNWFVELDTINSDSLGYQRLYISLYQETHLIIIPNLNINKWYNLSIDVKYNTIRVYVDGLIYYTSAISIDLLVPYTSLTNITNVYIGFNISGNYSYNGYMDNLKIITNNYYFDNIRYRTSFLEFGYTPTYNIYSYLNNISSVFNNTKEFESMPILLQIPYSNSSVTISGNVNGYNLIVFHESLYEEWISFWNNTYIDVVLYDGILFQRTNKLLIRDKYEQDGYYIIKLDSKIDIGALTNFTNIDLISRRFLTQISDDLQELNNIHVSNRIKEYGINSYSTLENEINSKFYTDSYAKILLSDKDIKNNLTGLIYYDYKNELSLNIISVEQDFKHNIINTFAGFDYSGMFLTYKLGITFDSKHSLSSGQLVFIEFTGNDPNTSSIMNPDYNGWWNVLYTSMDNSTSGNNLTEYQVILSTHNNLNGLGINFSIDPDPGYITYKLYDPYLNYNPIDIFDVGIDKNWKQSILVNPENRIIDGNTHNLINIDLSKHRFNLIDGLTLPMLISKYSWILEAEIEDALIGLDSNNNIVWYKGTWLCGRWFGGTWYSGTWVSGTWYSGNWYSVQVTYNSISAKFSLLSSDKIFSTWLGGDWVDGTWDNGTWYSGTWYSGTWNAGNWNGGQWNNGTWVSGNFRGGTWVDGIWKSGDFSCDYDIANWIDGSWNGGDFANGYWYNGKFDKIKNNKSRFGTRSTNWRKAIWYSGEWSSGEFHSNLNLNDSGQPIESSSNRNSIWYTGLWNDGTWFGGIVYNIDWRSGTWYNGVIYGIDIIGYDPIPLSSKSSFTISGVFRFNRLSNFYVIDNYNNTTWSPLGNNVNPGKYTVIDVEFLSNGNTKVYVQENLDSLVAIPELNYTGLSCVSNITNCKWYNGVWYNGIFDGDYFNSGQWYNGVFKKGNWLH